MRSERMRSFAIIGHLARTSGDFSLNDLPGSAGRMDVLCRCVNATLFLSHDIRRDVECTLLLCGPPDPPKIVLFRGDAVRYLSPDERSAGSLIKKALAIPCGTEFRESTPGVYVRRGDLAGILQSCTWAVLDESGADIRVERELPDGFILSDHLNFTEAEEAQIRDLPRYSVGPTMLHADHTITVVQNEWDRRRCGWR
jgi:tRNA (pseudouridine54-N1)-methyltransferase